MESAYLILLCINSALLPVFGAALWLCHNARKKLDESTKLFNDLGKAASESSKSQAKVIQDLADRVAGLQLQAHQPRR